MGVDGPMHVVDDAELATTKKELLETDKNIFSKSGKVFAPSSRTSKSFCRDGLWPHLPLQIDL